MYTLFLSDAAQKKAEKAEQEAKAKQQALAGVANPQLLGSQAPGQVSFAHCVLHDGRISAL